MNRLKPMLYQIQEIEKYVSIKRHFSLDELRQISEALEHAANVVSNLGVRHPVHLGEVITCRDATGLFRPCSCGGDQFKVETGAGPHVGQLVCVACARRGRWLSPRHIEGESS